MYMIPSPIKTRAIKYGYRLVPALCVVCFQDQPTLSLEELLTQAKGLDHKQTAAVRERERERERERGECINGQTGFTCLSTG